MDGFWLPSSVLWNAETLCFVIQLVCARHLSIWPFIHELKTAGNVRLSADRYTNATASHTVPSIRIVVGLSEYRLKIWILCAYLWTVAWTHYLCAIFQMLLRKTKSLYNEMHHLLWRPSTFEECRWVISWFGLSKTFFQPTTVTKFFLVFFAWLDY